MNQPKAEGRKLSAGTLARHVKEKVLGQRNGDARPARKLSSEDI